MNQNADFDRIAQSWLQDGPTEMPDRSLQAALDEVHVTSQRRFGAARRTFPMNGNAFRLAAAAVVGLLIIVVGSVYLGSNSSGGVGASPEAIPSPTASPSAALGATPVPSSSNLTPGQLCSATSCLAGNLDPGTYWVEPSELMPARLTFTAPAGWVTDSGWVYTHVDEPNQRSLVTYVVPRAYGDICQWHGTLTEAGTTSTEFADFLVAQKGGAASAPTDVTVGGFPAKRIELTLPTDFNVAACNVGAPGDGPIVRFWPDPGPDESGGTCMAPPSGPPYCDPPGSTDVVYAVDVAGERLVIVAGHRSGSSAEDVAELQAIIDSIVIEPAVAGSSPAVSSAP